MRVHAAERRRPHRRGRTGGQWNRRCRGTGKSVSGDRVGCSAISASEGGEAGTRNAGMGKDSVPLTCARTWRVQTLWWGGTSADLAREGAVQLAAFLQRWVIALDAASRICASRGAIACATRPLPKADRSCASRTHRPSCLWTSRVRARWQSRPAPARSSTLLRWFGTAGARRCGAPSRYRPHTILQLSAS